ncbi:MAG: multidrug effflux MFS transporter [Saprospiraceae bacterium]|nr:multidrug effflux MFS transporter [Saprospiraceae bacterium]
MTRRQTNLLIVLIGSIAALGPFTIDMYLPAFPGIAKYFGTDEKHVAYTLTSFFVGISLGQLIYGPLLDRFGRKIPLLSGLSLYLMASLACASAPSLTALIGFRFIQALGSSVGMVAGSAIIRDLFDTRDVAKMLSSVILVMGAAPIIAPSLGSFVIHHLGWQAIFVFLAIVSALIILGLYFFLHAGKGPDPSFEFKPAYIFRKYWNTLKQTDFLLYSVSGSIAMSMLFAYISTIPFVLMSIYQVSEAAFGWLFGLNAFGFILGSQVNRYALRRFDLIPLTVAVALFSVIIGIVLLVMATFFSLSLELFCILIFQVLFSLGIVNPNTTALSLDKISVNVGLATALNGSLRMGIAAVVSGIAGSMYNGTVFPLLIMLLTLSLLSLISLVAAKNHATPRIR